MKRPSIFGPFFVSLIVGAVLAGSIGTAQQPPGAAAPQPQGQVGRGRGRGPAPTDTLGEGPWDLSAGATRFHVSVVTKGVDHPWGIAFLPDGNMLVTERPGRLRVIRNGVLDPTPIGPLPPMLATGLGGMLDVAPHPQFAQNHLIYFAYSKPGEGQGNATTAVYRARWDGSTLADGRDILVADAYWGGPGTDQSRGPASGSYGARLAFDRAGLLYVSLGDRNYGPKAQDPASHIGKILRIKDDGSVPADNPFIGRAGYKPEIWTLGHRNPLGLAFNDADGTLWSSEEGPQGGDELNLIVKGKNYGWPEVSLGRNYDGTIVGRGFTAPGFEEPVVFWVPAIAVSGLSFYNGDRFPAWKGNAFVGAMRNNTGKHIQRVWFNAKGEPIGREIIIPELKQRIREVKPGLDGNIYALTDETFGAVLKIEPAAAAVTQPAVSGQTAAAEGPGAVIGTGTFTAFVENMDRSLAFYHDVFDMEVPPLPAGGARAYNNPNPRLFAMFAIPGAKERHQSARVPGTRVNLELMEIQNVEFRTVPLLIQDPGAATPVLIVRDLEAALARVRQANVKVVTPGGKPVAGGDGGRAVLIRDVDGRFVELRQPATLPDAAAPAPGNIVDLRLSIAVGDMERTTHIYRDVLGFKVEGETPFSADKSVQSLTGLSKAQVRRSRVQAPGSPLWIEFVEYRGVERAPLHVRIQDRGAARLQLRAQNLDALVRAMKAAGLTVLSDGGVAVPIPPNLKGALVADPDNFFLTPFAPCDGCAPARPSP